MSNATWVCGLYPEGASRTRLVTRLRATPEDIRSRLFLDLGEIVMMRKCMLGIKRRAEQPQPRNFGSSGNPWGRDHPVPVSVSVPDDQRQRPRSASSRRHRSQLTAAEDSDSNPGQRAVSAAAWPPPNRSWCAVADQVIRSASSVPANLAEGHGRTGRVRMNYWRIAYASAKEVDSHLRLLAHAGAINRSRANDALESFDQVRAMTWRLLNPNP